MKKFLSVILSLLIAPLFLTKSTMACNPGCTAGKVASAASSIARNAAYVGIGAGVVGVTALSSLYIAKKVSGVPDMKYGNTEWTNLSLHGVKVSYKKSDLNGVVAKLDQNNSLISKSIKIARANDNFINVKNDKQTVEPNNIYLIGDSQIQNKTINFYNLDIPKELKNSDKLIVKATFSLKNLDGSQNLSDSNIDFNLFKNQKSSSITKKLSKKTVNSSFDEVVSLNNPEKSVIQKEFIIGQKSVISSKKPVIFTISYKNSDKKTKDTKCLIYAGIVDIEKANN